MHRDGGLLRRARTPVSSVDPFPDDAGDKNDDQLE
jgi:hypothetical protein